LFTRFMISNEQGAETSLFCATAPEAASQTGLYYDGCRPVEPSVLARDEMLAGELYERSLRWTGLA
jgi:retinol dehydrogenase-12